jgi:hypothetical protein
MSVALTFDEHLSMVWEQVALGCDEVITSTFGASLSRDWGAVFQALRAEGVRARVIVGVAPSVKDVNEVGRRLVEVARVLTLWPTVQYRLRHRHHAKLWAFKRDGRWDSAIVGGRNLTDSGWADLSFLVGRRDAGAAALEFDKWWAAYDWKIRPDSERRR